MATPPGVRKLVPSILDRLIDHEPRVSAEPADERGQLVAQALQSIRRDLEWLLNSKRTAVALPVELRQIETSLLTYGLPDFSDRILTNPHHQASLRRSIEELIRRFEPRLAQVSVRLMEGVGLQRDLRFQIDAMLRAEPQPIPVTFDSTLALHNRAFHVTNS